jgi:hypothetical protein
MNKVSLYACVLSMMAAPLAVAQAKFKFHAASSETL